jgi:hypothetical protein
MPVIGCVPTALSIHGHATGLSCFIFKLVSFLFTRSLNANRGQLCRLLWCTVNLVVSIHSFDLYNNAS